MYKFVFVNVFLTCLYTKNRKNRRHETKETKETEKLTKIDLLLCILYLLFSTFDLSIEIKMDALPHVVIPNLGDLDDLGNLVDLVGLVGFDLHERGFALRDIGERIESIVSGSTQKPKETVVEVVKRKKSAVILASLVETFNKEKTASALLDVRDFVNSPEFVEPYCIVSSDYVVTREQHNITIRYIKKHFSTDPTLMLNFSKTSSIMKEEKQSLLQKKIDALNSL